MNRHTKPYVEAIFQKTYQYHGVEKKPFGISETKTCSYAAGCAIGISMPKELRDSVENDGLDDLYENDGERVGPALFGPWWRDVSDEELSALNELQSAHDDCAKQKAHLFYKHRVETLAKEFGLSLTPPLEEHRENA